MEAKAASGLRVSAKTAGLVIDALRHYAREHFAERPASYQIDVWTAVASRVESRYADIADFFAAKEVFELAVRQRPAARITLRQGARVIERAEGITGAVEIRP